MRGWWWCASLLAWLTFAAPSLAANDAPLTAQEIADLRTLAAGDRKALEGIDVGLLRGEQGRLREVLRVAPFKDGSYGPAELRVFRNEARAWSSDVPSRAADAKSAIGGIRDAVYETGGQKYIDAHGGGKEGRAYWQKKIGRLPTAENAVNAELATGRPTPTSEGNQTWHIEKLVDRSKQIERSVATLESIRDGVPASELAKIDPKLPAAIDDAIASGRQRIEAMQPAIDAWQRRAGTGPWDASGQSRTLLPSDRPPPGTTRTATTTPKAPSRPGTPAEAPATAPVERAPGAPRGAPAEAPCAATEPPADIRGGKAPTIPSRYGRGVGGLQAFNTTIAEARNAATTTITSPGMQSNMQLIGTATMAASATWTAMKVVQDYNDEARARLVNYNGRDFSERFEEWKKKNGVADLPSDRGIPYIVHFYPQDEVEKAVAARDKSKRGREAFDDMAASALDNFLRLRFIEEGKWKPPYSYTVAAANKTFWKWSALQTAIAYNDLIKDEPDGTQKFGVLRNGERKWMNRAEYDAHVGKLYVENFPFGDIKFSWRRDRAYDTPVPKGPNLGFPVRDLPRVNVLDAPDVATAYRRAQAEAAALEALPENRIPKAAATAASVKPAAAAH